MHLFALAPVRKLLLAPAAAALLAIASNASLAQDDPVSQAGRLSYLTGEVSIQQAGSDDWGQAYPNLPLGPGDRIFTDSDGRAEIQVGENYVRIGPNSDVTFVDATPDGISFGVAQGSVRIRSYGLWGGQSVFVNTPSGSATLAQPGELRVDVLAGDGATIFTNFSNDLLVTGAGGFEQHIGSWQSLELAGSNPVYPQWLQVADPDGLDAWSQQRDRQIAHAVSYRYVSPEIPGAAELDANGEWQAGTEYGAVWFPNNVSAGWAPYHDGHWINHAPWGWVWVEDEPWGYAPFHYGRWVSLGGRWGWVPGPPAAHPVWSPALVVFAGGIHFGGVGVSVWFPLGPGEPYRPWYHASPRYIDQVNISNIGESRRVHVEKTYVNIVNVTNVTNITYVNRTTAVTAMRSDDFAAGRPARQAAVQVDPHQMEHVQVLAAPEPRPNPRSIVGPPPTRPVPVSMERPALINQQGKLISARPGAQPVEPPVKAAPAFRPLPGRVVVAPPPGATAHPGTMTPMNPARQESRPAQIPAPAPAPGAPNRPNANPNSPAQSQPYERPVPQPPPAPYVRPTPPAAPQPNERPAPPTEARPNPQPPPAPYVRPNPPAAPQPNERPAPPTEARPNPQPPPAPYVRPNPPAAPQPNERPAPPPEARPNPQQPPAPYVRPNPPAAPPAAKPTPPPPAPPAAKTEKDKKPE